MFDCEFCEKNFQTQSKLARHEANIHDIGVVWYECNFEECMFKCKDKYNLKKHKAHKHSIDVTWHNCDIDGCVQQFKCSTDLRRHQRAVHAIGTVWFSCTIDQNCNKKFKTKPNLGRHIRTIHGIGTIWYQCEFCDYQAKAKKDLETHQGRLHDINVKWYQCDLCDYETKAKNDVYRHKQDIHNINVKWHHCPEKGCNHKTKRNFRLREHLEYLHDIGDKECDFCTNPRYKLINYNKKGITSNICRTCFRRATGKESRIEVTMSKYLDTHFSTEFLLGSDDRIYGEACQRYRPDKIYASPDLVLHIECDEQQHIYRGNNYSCDEKRITSIYDEFPGKKYVVIRWNPDKYTVPKNKSYVVRRQAKLELLLACMRAVIHNPPEELIKIIYMFYDEDNELLSRNIPHTLIYDEDDINFITLPK